ncbi:hypothetical protein vBPpSSYP_12 [Pseudomonas phage vB_PpS_SYP]|nr:hypothetical protein vBPpSSYP_12 [Pseudomonas phage vB_PpS_SYP]
MNINETIKTNLKQFFIQWELWAKLGGIGQEFEQVGLCSNLENWVHNNYSDTALQGISKNHTPPMYRSMLQSLIREAGYECLAYPFDSSSYAYFKAIDNDTVHLNPSRLSFVRDQIKCMV